MIGMLVMLAVTLTANISYGQQHAVKTNLANFAIAGGSLHYEHILGDASSAQLGLFFTGLSVDDTKFGGFGVIPQYRLYPGKKAAPQGFFVAPLLSYQTFSLETTSGGSTAKADYSLVGAGFDIGNQWLVQRTVSIELSLGLTFNSTKLSIETGGATEDDFSVGGLGGTAPRFGLSLGYAF